MARARGREKERTRMCVCVEEIVEKMSERESKSWGTSARRKKYSQKTQRVDAGH